jgi:hypothetical protein
MDAGTEYDVIRFQGVLNKFSMKNAVIRKKAYW